MVFKPPGASEEQKLSARRIRRRVCGLLAAIALCWSGTAGAQDIIEGGTALENSRGGAVRERAPGRMVTAGVSRAQEFQNSIRGGIEITEPAPVSSPRSELLAESIAAVFNQINLAIVGFHNLLLARAGRPAVIPESIIASVPTDDDDGRTDDADNADDFGGVDLGGLDIGGLLDQFGGR